MWGYEGTGWKAGIWFDDPPGTTVPPFNVPYVAFWPQNPSVFMAASTFSCRPLKFCTIDPTMPSIAVSDCRMVNRFALIALLGGGSSVGLLPSPLLFGGFGMLPV